MLLLSPITVNAWSLFGSYDDCILDNIKPSMTRVAVNTVRRSCRNKFPLPKKKSLDELLGCKDISLNKNELNNIKLFVEGKHGYSLWNENDFTVKWIEISYQIKNNKNTYTNLLTNDNSNLSFMSTFNKLTKYMINSLPGNIITYKMIEGSKQICD